jgi:hypothetical protein
MTPEEQRTAIAEACGYRRWKFGDPFLEGLRLADQKFNGYIRCITKVYPNGVTLDVDESPLYSFEEMQENFIPVNFWLTPDNKWNKRLPDYLNDLNAMHEAEKILANRYWTRYCQYLAELGGGSVRFMSVHATASQKAEAFLRTIGKWKD